MLFTMSAATARQSTPNETSANCFAMVVCRLDRPGNHTTATEFAPDLYLYFFGSYLLFTPPQVSGFI